MSGGQRALNSLDRCVRVGMFSGAHVYGQARIHSACLAYSQRTAEHPTYRLAVSMSVRVRVEVPLFPPQRQYPVSDHSRPSMAASFWCGIAAVVDP
jgi:hypothetical protein